MTNNNTERKPDFYTHVRNRTNKLSFFESILGTVGETPLVKLNKINFKNQINMFVKLEGFNPGGSIKDRPALNILTEAWENNVINKNTTIIESSSGNMAIGLAQTCLYYGLRFICVVDLKTTRKNIEILKILGAEVEEITVPDSETGEFLQARIKRVKELLKTHPNSFWTNQYENISNARSHFKTIAEILEALDGKLDYLFCSTSSCGTVRGCAEYLLEKKLTTKLIGVDAIGSRIFGQKPQKRLIPGHGSVIVPALLRTDLIDDVVHVDDWECVLGCRKLVHHEAIFVGGSSGGVLSAAEKYIDQIPNNSNCALIFPDRGERYTDTIFSDSWVLKHFGKLPGF
jgi:N-(2-amino-2-carboxyethyl)-L-glutamate synthase